MDGTQLFSTYLKSCEECKSKVLKNGKTLYSHYAVMFSVIGASPRLMVDFELGKGSQDSSNKDEGELTIAKRLLKRKLNTHRKLIDVIVYDALACNSVWINACIENKVIPVVAVKNNNDKSIKEVKARTNKGDSLTSWVDCKRNCVVTVYEQSFYMEGVEQPLRFVKFNKKGESRNQVMLITTDFEIPIETLYVMIHKRWYIENCTFQKYKKYNDLEHCLIHNANAIEAIISIFFTAANLMQLFIFKRLANMKEKLPEIEIIRRIEQCLHRIRYQEKYAFNTS